MGEGVPKSCEDSLPYFEFAANEAAWQVGGLIFPLTDNLSVNPADMHPLSPSAHNRTPSPLLSSNFAFFLVCLSSVYNVCICILEFCGCASVGGWLAHGRKKSEDITCSWSVATWPERWRRAWRMEGESAKGRLPPM